MEGRGLGMEYPIYMNGERAGRLSLSRQGLYRVFEGELPPGGELLGLWLCAGEERACLGPVAPGAEGRYFRRRFTALELKTLPEKPDHALALPWGAEERERQSSPAAKRPEPPAVRAEPPRPEPPAGAGREDQGLLWFDCPDGSLRAFDGRGSLIALPAELRQERPGARLMRIKGRDYMVFRY